MKCLVINLDRSPERLEHMRSEFARIGMPFERVAAVDARERPDLARAELPLDPLYGLRLSLPELCCFLSHRACWEMVADGDEPYCAVFEDDTVFCDGAGALLAGHGWIPADAEVVKLETFFRHVSVNRRRHEAGHGFWTARLRSHHFGTCGYVLSRQAARRMVDAADRIDMPVDHFVFNPLLALVQERVIYQLVPALCMQSRFVTDGNGLASILTQDRQEFQPKPTVRTKRPVAARIGREVKRFSKKLIRSLSIRKLVVPFDHPQSPAPRGAGRARYTALAKRAIDPA